MEVHKHQCPDDFKCPISLEVMSDPVILTSGHTFDRSSITRWLSSGNLTCPVSKLPLPPHPPLIPNHALRSLISNFASTSPPYLPSCHSPPPETLTLLSTLSFPTTTQTLTSIRRLSKHDPSFRRLILDSGSSPTLLRHVSAADCSDLQDLALRIVLDVSLDSDDAKVGLVADGAVDAVVEALLCSPSRALAATTLTSLAVADVNKCTIGAHPSAIPGLVSLLSSKNSRDRREAATALYTLCSFPENRTRTVLSGAVPMLVALADSGLPRAVEVLGLIAKCGAGKSDIRKIGSIACIMAAVLRGGIARGVEHALAVLNLVCCDSVEMQAEARKEGVLELALSFMGESGTIGERACVLVKILRTADVECPMSEKMDIR